jgi:hypothetical protein
MASRLRERRSALRILPENPSGLGELSTAFSRILCLPLGILC